MENDATLRRELTTLQSERRMDELAMKGHQKKLSEMLNGNMGTDMLDTLSGKKTVRLSMWQKFRYKIIRMFGYE